MVTSRAAADDPRRTGSGEALEIVEPFVTEVERREGLTSVRPRGELDVATAGTLLAVLNGIEGAEHLVLDLRGLSFIDSTGLHLLVALQQRAQRDGFRLSLLAPPAPVDKTIQLCGLDETLPFVEVVDALESRPRESASGGERRTRVEEDPQRAETRS